MKLCLIYNFAQHYRTNIFTLIDKEFDCDFVFGDSMGDVKKMDYSLLGGKVTENHILRFKGWTYQIGMIKQLRYAYSHYIILGDTHSVSTWLFAILARVFCHKKKVYFWTHGWYGKETRFEKILKKVFLRLPNSGIFTYGDYAKKLMKQNGFNEDKIYPIHNSLAYDQQLEIRRTLTKSDVYVKHFKNNNRCLIFVGRLTLVKKLDQILYAMIKSIEKGHQYNLILIGSGEKEEQLKSLTKELGLISSIWFYGPCYNEYELSTLIYNADLCVAPGNIGLTAMHSLVFGTPAITHNDYRWQMPEFEAIKEGVTGIFFERDNINDLSSKIDSWFSQQNYDRESIRKSCMDEIDTNWNPYFQLDLLKRIIKNE